MIQSRNVLIDGVNFADEAVERIRGVIRFVTDAVPALASNGPGLDQQTADGLACILEGVTDALGELTANKLPWSHRSEGRETA